MSAGIIAAHYVDAGGGPTVPGPTRFYLESSGSPAASPAFDAAWDITTSADRAAASLNKQAWTAIANKVSGAETSLADVNVLNRQFVSAPLDGDQTITGTVKGIIRVLESNSAANAYAQMVIRVVSGDGSTVRGTLLSAHASALSNEFVTALTNRKYPLGWSSPGTALTSVSALDGDRIVIEVGARHSDALTTSRTTTGSFGSGATREPAEDETGTGPYAPWLEFSQGIALEQTPGIVVRDESELVVFATPSSVPFGVVAADWLALSVVGLKSPVRTRTLPAGFTQALDITGGSGVATGVDVGSMRIYVDHKTLDGTETGNVSYAWSANPSPAIHAILKYAKPNVTSPTWSVAASSADDSTTGTGTGSIAGTAATDPGFQAGDIVVIGYASPTDAGTFTNPIITVPGCTLSAVREVSQQQTATANDATLWVLEATVLTGTSSGAPSFSADASDANAGAGPIAFVRIR